MLEGGAVKGRAVMVLEGCLGARGRGCDGARGRGCDGARGGAVIVLPSL